MTTTNQQIGSEFIIGRDRCLKRNVLLPGKIDPKVQLLEPYCGASVFNPPLPHPRLHRFKVYVNVLAILSHLLQLEDPRLVYTRATLLYPPLISVRPGCCRYCVYLLRCLIALICCAPEYFTFMSATSITVGGNRLDPRATHDHSQVV